MHVLYEKLRGTAGQENVDICSSVESWDTVGKLTINLMFSFEVSECVWNFLLNWAGVHWQNRVVNPTLRNSDVCSAWNIEPLDLWAAAEVVFGDFPKDIQVMKVINICYETYLQVISMK